MPKLLATLAATLLLTACASPSWQQSGVSPYDADSALAQCKYEIGLKSMKLVKNKELLGHCMEGKGYRWHK